MQIKRPAKQLAEVTDFFTRRPIEVTPPPSNGRSDYVIPLSTPSNRARLLAQAENFMGMCEDILWGSESRQQFGQLLEGLIDHFLPRNRFELELLRNIAEIQWAVRRNSTIAKTVFDTGEQVAGRTRLPRRTEDAMDSLRKGDALQPQLAVAISVFNSARRSNK